MSEIDTEKLILAMQKRPALYNRSDSSYYCHRKHKAKLWIEVCKEVFPSFDNFKSQKKVEYSHELQRRWKSLRTCFSRELMAQKKEKLKKEYRDGPVKKRKVYEYFNIMSFLLDSDVDAEVPDNDGGTRDSDYSRDLDDPLENVKDESIMYEPENVANNSHFAVENDKGILRPIFEGRNESFEGKILDMLKVIKKDEEDEDRQFMLSLVPSFRKLNPKQKFEARIEILRVLKNITFKDSGST